MKAQRQNLKHGSRWHSSGKSSSKIRNPAAKSSNTIRIHRQPNPAAVFGAVESPGSARPSVRLSDPSIRSVRPSDPSVRPIRSVRPFRPADPFICPIRPSDRSVRPSRRPASLLAVHPRPSDCPAVRLPNPGLFGLFAPLGGRFGYIFLFWGVLYYSHYFPYYIPIPPVWLWPYDSLV